METRTKDLIFTGFIILLLVAIFIGLAYMGMLTLETGLYLGGCIGVIFVIIFDSLPKKSKIKPPNFVIYTFAWIFIIMLLAGAVLAMMK